MTIAEVLALGCPAAPAPSTGLTTEQMIGAVGLPLSLIFFGALIPIMGCVCGKKEEAPTVTVSKTEEGVSSKTEEGV